MEIRMSNATGRLSAMMVCLTMAIGASGRAEAETIYQVSGVFGADRSGTTGLANGSFTATYQTDSFPTTPSPQQSFDSFSVSVFNASGTLVDTYGSSTGGSGFIAYFNGFTDEFIQLLNSDSSESITFGFVPVFQGTGAIVPTGTGTLSQDSSRFFNGGVVSITSGFSSPSAVPEPSSVALCGIAGVVGLVVARRRKRAA
jgi:PEP-CTERM motif